MTDILFAIDIYLKQRTEVEELDRGHRPRHHLDGAVVDEVPGEVGALAVVLHEVLEEGDDVEPGPGA